MAWTIRYTATVERHLRKLDKPVACRIVDYLDKRVAPLDDPRRRGGSLTGPMGGFWRYRVGDYRVICSSDDAEQVVLVVRVAHRRHVYRQGGD